MKASETNGEACVGEDDHSVRVLVRAPAPALMRKSSERAVRWASTESSVLCGPTNASSKHNKTDLSSKLTAPPSALKNKLFNHNQVAGAKHASYGATDACALTLGAGDKDKDSDSSACTIAGIIGSFGWFQFLVLLFSGLREGSVGYDAVVMSVILQPHDEFRCNTAPPDEFVRLNEEGMSSLRDYGNETLMCYVADENNALIAERHAPQTPILCDRWLFTTNTDGYTSFVADWSLVCGRHWLIALIESAYFLGLVTGNLAWGYYADKAGRRRAYLCAHTIALVAGWASVFTYSMELFAVLRFFSAFGLIGYNIIYSIQVELIGTQYRSFSTILNHLGWGLGVVCVPIAHHLLVEPRYMIAVAPMVTLLMFPWAFWLPESSRWLMAHDKFGAARDELVRAAKFNGKRHTPAMDKRIAILNDKISYDMQTARAGRPTNMPRELDANQLCVVASAAAVDTNRLQVFTADQLKQQQRPSVQLDESPYKTLWSSSVLLRDTLLLSYMSCSGHLFYYMLTINFAYIKNLSVEANFIISGVGEWISVCIGAVMLKVLSRKMCMAVCFFLMASSFIVQSVIDTDLVPELDTPALVTFNNAVGTLASLLLIFVVLIVNQEVYPTVIRQTGSSIVNTVGESGSTLAPMLIQLARIFGLWRAELVYTIMCAIGMLATYFVSKTDDLELTDV